jgi:hypothetical protein
MTFSSFSTGQNPLVAENILGLMLMSRHAVKLPPADRPFPQNLSQPHDRRCNLVFSGIAVSDDFFTGPTTNTSNITQRFSIVVVMKRQHSSEVGNAIQR